MHDFAYLLACLESSIKRCPLLPLPPKNNKEIRVWALGTGCTYLLICCVGVYVCIICIYSSIFVHVCINLYSDMYVYT